MAAPALRLAVVGLGRMGTRVIEAARRGGFSIARVYDTNPSPHALGVYPDLDSIRVRDPEQLWQAEFDILYVATTAPSHTQWLASGLGHGIRRFVVEKPFSTSVRQGRESLKLAAQSGARVIVNHSRRYWSNYRALKAMNGSQSMGDLRGVSITMGAGGLAMMGTHFLDLLNWMFDATPEAVEARVGQPSGPNPRGREFADPGASAVLRYSGDRRAYLEVADDTCLGAMLEFRFTYGRVLILDEDVPWRIMTRRVADRDLPLTRYGGPMDESSFPEFQPFDMIGMTLDAIRDAAADSPAISNASVGVAAMESYAAIRFAGETGGTVTFPLPQAAVEKSFPIP